MLTNFEEITVELTEDELKVLPFLLAGLKARTEHNPIKAPEIVKNLNAFLVQQGIPVKITEARLRKMCNYIRSNAIIPLIATSKGYFVSYDSEWIRSQVKSLQERARSILVCADGLERILYNSQNLG